MIYKAGGIYNLILKTEGGIGFDYVRVTRK